MRIKRWTKSLETGEFELATWLNVGRQYQVIFQNGKIVNPKEIKLVYKIGNKIKETK